MTSVRPSPGQLLAEIRGNLGTTIGSGGRRHQLASLYEASIWSLAWDAGSSIGAHCTLLDGHGNPCNRVLLRNAPSGLQTGRGQYTHLEITGSRDSVQAHQGIYLEGISGARHQADFALIPKAEIDRAFMRGHAPRARQLVYAIEAKLYSRPVGIGVARGFLGLRLDFAKHVALATSAPEGTDVRLIAQHAKGIDVAFHDAAPGRASWEELRRVIARHLRAST